MKRENNNNKQNEIKMKKKIVYLVIYCEGNKKVHRHLIQIIQFPINKLFIFPIPNDKKKNVKEEEIRFEVITMKIIWDETLHMLR